MSAPPDPAAARFALLQAVRASGLIMAALGAAIVSGAVAAVAAWPQPLGVALLLIGVADFFVVPLLLARRWREPPR